MNQTSEVAANLSDTLRDICLDKLCIWNELGTMFIVCRYSDVLLQKMDAEYIQSKTREERIATEYLSNKRQYNTRLFELSHIFASA